MICPVCSTDMDFEDRLYGNGWVEAYCVTCNKYRRCANPVSQPSETPETTGNKPETG